MILDAHQSLRAVDPISVTRVLIRAENGTPLVLVVEGPGGSVTVTHAGQGDAFQRALREYGIHRVVRADVFEDIPAGQLLTDRG